jgi:hypothetical protein
MIQKNPRRSTWFNRLRRALRIIPPIAAAEAVPVVLTAVVLGAAAVTVTIAAAEATAAVAIAVVESN